MRTPFSVHSKFSFIDLADLAEAAKIVWTEPKHFRAIDELAETFPMSHVEVTEIFSRVLKRKVRVEREEIGDWKSRAGRMSAHSVAGLSKMFAYYDQWSPPGISNALR